jgi:hypothetical protein
MSSNNGIAGQGFSLFVPDRHKRVKDPCKIFFTHRSVYRFLVVHEVMPVTWHPEYGIPAPGDFQKISAAGA